MIRKFLAGFILLLAAGCPTCVLFTGGREYTLPVPDGLKRYYGRNDLHYITCSCYRRQPLLDAPDRYRFFLEVLERVRQRYGFRVIGYVLMPEHFHLLVNEPESGDPSRVMFALKQTVAKRMIEQGVTTEHFWQRRFYDFNVMTARKKIEKLRYMHWNPVVRGLVTAPEDWPWSSCRYYLLREPGIVKIEFDPVTVNSGLGAKVK